MYVADSTSTEYLITYKDNWEEQSLRLDSLVEKLRNNGLGIGKKNSLDVVKHWSCELCNKCFTCKSKLQKHTIVHSGEKPHTCYICEKSFKQLHHLKRHSIIHSSKNHSSVRFVISASLIVVVWKDTLDSIM